MSIIIDTGIFVAFHNRRDENHERAKQLIKSAAAGEYGLSYTSDYIFDEAVTLAAIRTRRQDIASSLGKMILGEGVPKFLLMLRVNDHAFKEAWGIFKKTDGKLSFTDCTTIALSKIYGAGSVMSFDSDFDGLLHRVS